MLAPVTVLFLLVFAWCVRTFIIGFMNADGEKLISGAFGSLAFLMLSVLVGTQLRRTIRDARVTGAQRRKR